MLAADGGAVVRGPGGALVVCAESLVECLWGAAVECAPNLWCMGLGQGLVGTLWHVKALPMSDFIEYFPRGDL